MSEINPITRAEPAAAIPFNKEGVLYPFMSWVRVLGKLVVRSVRSPRLVPALIRTAWRFRARDWYRRPPFLPLPDRTYLRWRMYTAYGNEEAIPPARDVERYAHWSARR